MDETTPSARESRRGTRDAGRDGHDSGLENRNSPLAPEATNGIHADCHDSFASRVSRPASRDLSLLRLCQLVSPALPVGAYHFSQGLEYAVHAGWVSNESTAAEWIEGLARNAVGTLDAPILFRLHDAWSNSDRVSVEQWSRHLLASRETAELRTEERHMGKALAKVLVELDIKEATKWISHDGCGYVAMFALAATEWRIERSLCVHAYLWAWSENQVLAALKLLPIGQSAGQRILNRILPTIPAIAARAATLADDAVCVATPLHSFASARHETQYSRLFRS